MDGLREKIEVETKKQEKKANVRTLKCFFWLFAGMLLVGILTWTNFFVIDNWAINTSFSVAVVLLIIPAIIAIRGKLHERYVKYVLLATLCLIVGVLTAMLSFHATLLYVLPLIFASQYRKKGPLWFVFIFSCITLAASSLFGFYHGLCDANLLIEGNHTYEWYMQQYQGSGLFVSLNESPVYIILVFATFPRSIILLIYTIILRYVIISNEEDAKEIANLTYHKETDFRTKLFNRNKYEEMCKEYYPKQERVAVIFWDLNNLKLTNDTYGHAEGDALIDKLASVLYEYTDDRCKAYHIGGDEFLLIVENPKATETDILVTRIEESLKGIKTDLGLEVSAAVGYAEGAGFNISEIKNLADEKMYQNKVASKKARES